MNPSSPSLTAALRTSAALLFAAVGTSCDLDKTLVPGGNGFDGPTMMANVVAFDESEPSLNGLTHMDGTVTMEGIDVELWDGSSWLNVASQLGAATVPVGDGSAGVTIMPDTEIPNADYTRVRLSAARGTATISMTVDGQRFGTDGVLGDGPMVFERDVDIVDHNGVRTFRLAIKPVTEVTRHVGPDGSESLLMSGDFGSGALARTAIVASDGSDPAALGLSALEGRLKLEGIMVELFDGVNWQTVVQDREGASFRVAQILSPTPLLRGAELPPGTFTQIRLSAERAWAGLALSLNGQRYGGEALLGENVSVEKDLNVLNLNGAQLLWMVFETVTSVTPAASADGAPAITIDGDFGSATLLPPGRTVTKVVASDGSDPDVEGLDNLEGKLALQGIQLELFDENTGEWQLVVEDRDGARFHIGEPREAVPLARSDDLTGDYSRARLSVRRAAAAVALTLGDQRYRGEAVLGENVVVEKDLVGVQEHDVLSDHNVRVLWMVFQTAVDVVPQTAADGSNSVVVKGDFGEMTLESAPPPGIHTAIVASDASEPKIDAVHGLEGKLLLGGISLELLDGDRVIKVLDGLDHAAFEIGEAREATLLLRSDDIPDGNYTKARLYARQASARLALTYGDQRYAGHAVLGENVMVEKEIEIIQSADASGFAHGRIIWMMFETVIDVTELASSDGTRAVVVEGDFGSGKFPQVSPDAPQTAIVASDASNPEIDALHSLKGKLWLEGVSMELQFPDGEWRTVLEDLERASFDVGAPRSPTLLFRSDDLPPGDFARARLKIRRASAGLALHLGEHHYRGEAVLGEGLMLEKAVEVIRQHDAADNIDAAHNADVRILWMLFETVIDISRVATSTGDPGAVLIEGEFGTATIPQVPPPTGIKFEVIERVHTTGPSNIHERARLVIRTLAEWEEFWNKLHDSTAPKPDRPAINFDEHMVIVAAMGERSTGGYGIDIEEVSESDQGIAVLVAETSPGSDCVVPQVITAPVTAVVTAQTDGEVAFEEVERKRDCA